MKFFPLFFLVFILSLFTGIENVTAQDIWLQQVNLIDGTGKSARKDVDVLIRAGMIDAIRPHQKQAPKSNSKVQLIDLSGKTIMPLLIDAHGHLGLLKGMQVVPENYTAENIRRQLQKYLAFGVGSVLSLGTDREAIIPLRDASRKGELPGATIYTATYGFGVENGIPPLNMGAEVRRPATAAAAREAVRQLVPLKPDMIKIWVDGSPKMKREVYNAIIQEAHLNHIKVAAHVYQVADARQLVADGVDVLAHSVRDQEMDDELLKQMEQKGVVYIPTLSLDKYNFVYADDPEWMGDAFFKASLEPGVLEMLTDTAQIRKMKNDPDREKKIAAYKMAVHNLKRVHAAGIKVAMGTDSGAQPIRAQGFSEHLELQLMTEAGLTPLEVISCATQNGAQLLGIDNSEGTLQPGKKADFMVLTNDPSINIRASESIEAVWKNGKKVSGKVE